MLRAVSVPRADRGDQFSTHLRADFLCHRCPSGLLPRVAGSVRQRPPLGSKLRGAMRWVDVIDVKHEPAARRYYRDEEVAHSSVTSSVFMMMVETASRAAIRFVSIPASRSSAGLAVTWRYANRPGRTSTIRSNAPLALSAGRSTRPAARCSGPRNVPHSIPLNTVAIWGDDAPADLLDSERAEAGARVRSFGDMPRPRSVADLRSSQVTRFTRSASSTPTIATASNACVAMAHAHPSRIRGARATTAGES